MYTRPTATVLQSTVYAIPYGYRTAVVRPVPSTVRFIAPRLGSLRARARRARLRRRGRGVQLAVSRARRGSCRVACGRRGVWSGRRRRRRARSAVAVTAHRRRRARHGARSSPDPTRRRRPPPHRRARRTRRPAAAAPQSGADRTHDTRRQTTHATDARSGSGAARAVRGPRSLRGGLAYPIYSDRYTR